MVINNIKPRVIIMSYNLLKPNYIPEEFLIATKHGWVDTRYNEVVVAIPHLDKKIKSLDELFVKEEIVEAEKNETISDDIQENIDEKIDDIVNENVSAETDSVTETSVEEVKPKRRGRPAKNK